MPRIIGSDPIASGRLTRPMQQPSDQPAPGSHDRSQPSGALEQSAADLFDAMLAAREAEERGENGPLHEFYRILMSGTLLLPVPPEHGDEAREALASAVNDDEQVEISVMLARERDGEPVSVVFGSVGSAGGMGAAANRETCRFPVASPSPTSPRPACRRSWIRPGRCRTASRSTSSPPWPRDGFRGPTVRCSSRRPVARSWFACRATTRATSSAPWPMRSASTEVEAAFLVETDDGGQPHLLLGLLGGDGASATVDVPDGTDVVWLEEPLLAQVRAVAEPFHRRGRG